MAGAGVHDQLLPFAQHDHEAPCAHERAPTLDDQLEHVLERDLPDRHRHVARRLQAAEGLLRLLAAALTGLVQLRVADRDRRPVGEDHRGLLVCLGELAVRLLRQVQVAPHLAADHDRHPQEAAHRRMPRREPVAAGVLPDIRQPQRLRVLDQRAQHAPPAREVADRAARVLVDARRQELFEPAVALVEDPQRRVARPRDLPRRLEHAVKHDALVELGREDAAHVEQPPNPRLIRGCLHATGV